MANDQLTLIPHSGSSLSQIGPRGGQILAEMVNGALALSRGTGSDTRLTRRFRIGDHELCEPDYQQILLWAKAMEMVPETVIERLLKVRKYNTGKGNGTAFENGRIIKLAWDMALLPLDSFEWVKGLEIETIDCSGCQFTELDLSAVPLLTELSCGGYKLTELDLSAIPLLTELYCVDCKLTELELSAVPLLTLLCCAYNQLIELELSAVPLLTRLWCSDNQLTELELSAVPLLTLLSCASNQLTELELSSVTLLTALDCCDNQLTELDLSAVPLLTELWCYNNQLTELDIRPLKHLAKLSYDKERTRLIQRADQNF